MAKSLKYFHKLFFLGLFVFLLGACSEEDIIYKKTYSDAEKLELSESLLNGAGTDLYYQGTVGERMIINEGICYNPGNAWGQRELGVPYLKRGFASEAQKYYKKAVEADAEEWLGYKAYCWLYFYRDYEMALEEIDRYDAFTPDFVDYPQSTSVNYMRGICHLQLGNYKEATHFLNLHVDMETEDVGLKYVESIAYLLLGMSYHKQGLFEKADSVYSVGLVHNQNTSDLHFYKAQNLLSMGSKKEAEQSFTKAQEWYTKGAKHGRPYVEEFYAIYQEDLNAMRLEF